MTITEQSRLSTPSPPERPPERRVAGSRRYPVAHGAFWQHVILTKAALATMIDRRGQELLERIPTKRGQHCGAGAEAEPQQASTPFRGRPDTTDRP